MFRNKKNNILPNLHELSKLSLQNQNRINTHNEIYIHRVPLARTVYAFLSYSSVI